MIEISQKLIDAKNQIVQLFLDLKAAGIEVEIEHNYGGYGSLDLREVGKPGQWVELTNENWHPEWSK